MCGIVGATARRDVAQILLTGLKRLEYRGYDSAGMAIVNQQGNLQLMRAVGKVQRLEAKLQHETLDGFYGIAHTRWATHGEPSERNAHPHVSQETIAVVHNGIIENHQVIQDKLRQSGYTFSSETDSELIAHLIHHYYQQGKNTLDAIKKAAQELEGAFALGIINSLEPDTIYALRRGSPLVIGLGIDENFIASDPLALAQFAQKFIYLEEGDAATITRREVWIVDKSGQRVERPLHSEDVQSQVIEKGHYRHFMEKEIFEQPEVLRETMAGCLSRGHILDRVFGAKAPEVFDQVERIQIVACGTSYHAGLVTKYWIEDHVGIPCQVEVASEFRYRNHYVGEKTLFVTISQSGETADTLAALQQAKQKNYLSTLAICNVATSSLVRESELVFMTRAGTEIGVASTKAFTTQLIGLLFLTLALARRRTTGDDLLKVQLQALKELPQLIQSLLDLNPKIKKLAKCFANKEHALFLGRGIHYPVALEGALKLKEISYIHAEAYPAGELKHGPLALVDKNMPVIAVAPNDELLGKLVSNLEEVRARGGELYVFASEGIDMIACEGLHVVSLPAVNKLISPLAFTIPLQLLAYHVAVTKGTDVDQPRNLAKSVTVE